MTAAPFAERDRFRLWAAAAIVVVAALAYANAVANGFVVDDIGVIARNPLVHSLSGVWRAFVHPYWPEDMGGGQYRPLAVASFALDWAISGGDPRWFHLVNVLWHVATCLVLWLLLSRLLSPMGALLGALVFAVHPVHVEAVANTVGRLELMAAFFVLGALILHRDRSRWAPLAFTLGLLSKENAVVFLGVAAAHDLLLAGDPRQAFRDRRWLYAVYGAVAAAYAVVLAALFHGQEFVVPAATWYGASTGQRLLTVATIIPHYARLLFVPFSLSADYTPRVIELARGWSPLALLGVAIVALAVVAVARSWRRAPVLAFAIVFFAVTISPVSNVLFPSGVVLAERTLYLPSVTLALLAGLAAERLAARDARVVLPAAAVVLTAFAVRTWTRTPVWRSNRALFVTLVQQHPESYRAHQALGRVLAGMGRWPDAAREYRIARSLFDRDGYLYRESAEAALQLGDAPRASALLDSAVALLPGYGVAWLRRADTRYRLGDYAGARVSARRAWALLPDSARAILVVALSAQRQGALAAADSAYREGLAHHPESWELHAGYADLLAARGDTAAAVGEGRHADAIRGRMMTRVTPGSAIH